MYFAAVSNLNNSEFTLYNYYDKPSRILYKWRSFSLNLTVLILISINQEHNKAKMKFLTIAALLATVGKRKSRKPSV